MEKERKSLTGERKKMKQDEVKRGKLMFLKANHDVQC